MTQPLLFAKNPCARDEVPHLLVPLSVLRVRRVSVRVYEADDRQVSEI